MNVFLLLCKFVLISPGQQFSGSFFSPPQMKDSGNRVNKVVWHGNGAIISSSEANTAYTKQLAWERAEEWQAHFPLVVSGMLHTHTLHWQVAVAIANNSFKIQKPLNIV